jgi:hypothetical protein
LALVIGYVIVDVLPAALANSDRLSPDKVVEEEGRIRTALVTLVAGIAASLGAVYTARTFALNRRGQNTERFTRAVDQLGNRESPDVRLGGIYALGQLLRDSPQDHSAIIDILTAYVRERYPGVPKDHAGSDQPSLEAEPVGADARAVIKLLQRRDLALDSVQGVTVDLSETNLCGIEAKGLSLAQADLSGIALQNAMLPSADFRGANMVCARLDGAVLRGARLKGVVLRSAVLSNARLQRADLSGAQLQRADLRSAHYDKHTVWTGALYDERTQWPEGFDPGSHACLAEQSATKSP